jgi:L-asparaginase II
MRRFPRLIGGTGRAVSELTAAVPGLVCKEGAEGVWAAALPDGRAFAAKIDDGSARGLGPLLAATLRHWGFDGSVVARWAEVAVLGGGEPVGAISPSRELRALLGR